MAATRLNYICVFREDSQIYGAGSKDVALSTPPPQGVPLEDKKIFFITHKPDTGEIVGYELPHEEVMAAPLQEKKSKNVKETDNP